MARMDRIRRKVIARIMNSADWWEESAQSDSGRFLITHGQVARHLQRQAQGRRRQIVDQLIEMSTPEPAAGPASPATLLDERRQAPKAT